MNNSCEGNWEGSELDSTLLCSLHRTKWQSFDGEHLHVERRLYFVNFICLSFVECGLVWSLMDLVVKTMGLLMKSVILIASQSTEFFCIHQN